jgi:protein O-GlcNAc transferase
VGLLPAMGIIGFHDMIAADRHAYLPLVGILVVLAYLLCRLWDTAKTASARRLRQVGTLAVMFALVGLELLATREYLAHWRDTETLNRHMLALAPHEPVLHNSLARALAEQGRFEEAVKHYTEALHHKSSVAGALGLEVGIASKIHFHLANALGRLGRLKEAVGHYEMASRIRPNSPDVHNNVGKALAEMGMLDEAIVHHSEAIRLEPGYAQAYCYRGIAFGRQRKLEQAAADFVTAIRLRPDYAEARMNLGIVLFHQGEFDRAIGQFRQALRIQPRDARIHCNLGVALMEKGNTDDALKEFRMALRCDPDFSQARKLLEDTLADKTDPELR